MINKTIIKGYKPLCYIDKNILLLSKGNILFSYDLTECTLKKITLFEISVFYTIMSFFSLTRRFFRLEYRNAIKVDTDRYLLTYKNTVLLLNLISRTIEIQKIDEKGLSFTKISDINGFDNMICFGDYKQNFSKDEISINGFINNRWEKLYTFEKGEIEHVHAIIPDKINSRVWILTGDFDNSSCIWIAENNFTKVKPIKRGSQMYRACVAFPFQGGLLYATDSQIEMNYINYLKPCKSGEFHLETICAINGPCIYGTQLKEDFIFSTTVEPYNGLNKIDIIVGLLTNKPGKGIITPNSEIIKINNEFKKEKLYTNPKDLYPFIFQFGTIVFPTDECNNDKLVFYNVSLINNNNCTEIWHLN